MTGRRMFEHVRIPSTNRIEAVPVQGILPINAEHDGDLRLYRMVFPFLPPSKNKYDGWLPEWQASAKRKWIKAIAEEVRRQDIPQARRIGLAAVLVFPTANRRDPQNYTSALWNWVPDGLVRAGVIPDDDAGKIDFGENLGLTFKVDNRVAPKEKRMRTHIALTMEVTGG